MMMMMMTVGGMGFIPERLLMMMMMMIYSSRALIILCHTVSHCIMCQKTGELTAPGPILCHRPYRGVPPYMPPLMLLTHMHVHAFTHVYSMCAGCHVDLSAWGLQLPVDKNMSLGHIGQVMSMFSDVPGFTLRPYVYTDPPNGTLVMAAPTDGSTIVAAGSGSPCYKRSERMELTGSGSGTQAAWDPTGGCNILQIFGTRADMRFRLLWGAGLPPAPQADSIMVPRCLLHSIHAPSRRSSPVHLPTFMPGGLPN